MTLLTTSIWLYTLTILHKNLFFFPDNYKHEAQIAISRGNKFWCRYDVNQEND